MAFPPKTRTYPGNLSLSQLQDRINYQENIVRKTTSISVNAGQTVSVHDNTTQVPPNSLVILEDPNGNVATPDGTTPLLTGKAMIGGAEKKVAAFRKGAAGGTATTTATTTTTATPEPVGDTGPEGNPNLNPDGTPRTGTPSPPPSSPPPPSPPRANSDDEPTGGAEDI